MAVTRWVIAGLLALAFTVGLFGAFYALIIDPVVVRDAQPDNNTRLNISVDGLPGCTEKQNELVSLYETARQCSTAADCVFASSTGIPKTLCGVSIHRTYERQFQQAQTHYRTHLCDRNEPVAYCDASTTECIRNQGTLVPLIETGTDQLSERPTYSG